MSNASPTDPVGHYVDIPLQVVQSQYQVTVLLDVGGHEVVYDAIGSDAPLRIVTDIVRRHVRDDGTCISSESVAKVVTSNDELRGWPEFADFEHRLKHHLSRVLQDLLAAGTLAAP